MEKFIIDNFQEILIEEGNWKIISNGNPLAVVPENLFKYYCLNENNIDALQNGYFYLSNPKHFNDPFDCSKNLIFENQRELKDWEYVESLNNLNDKGITCFSENGIQPLMWGHYTNSYRGFAIKLKPEFIIPNNNLSKLLKVVYSNNPNSISEKSAFAEQYQFIIKLEDWKYENEWRLIVNNPKENNNRFIYNLNAIEEILIGYQIFDPRNESEVILRDNFFKVLTNQFQGIPLFTIGPDQTKFTLKKMKFKFGTVEDLLGRFKT